MRSDLQKKTINSIFVLALIIFISMGWQAHRQMQSVIRSDALENYSFAIIRQLDLLLTTVTDAETGQRGYLITGDPGYLKPYHAALARLADTRRELRNMTKDDPAQQNRIDGMDVLIDRKLGALKDNLVLRERQGFEASRARLVATLDEGKQVMEGIRSLIAESQQSEQQRLLKKSSAKAEEIRYTLGMMQAGGAFALAMLILAFFLLNRENAQRAETEEALRAQNEELEVARDRDRLQNWIKSGLNQLNDVVRGDRTTEDLTGAALTFLCSYLKAGVGVLYLAEEQKDELAFAAGYAFEGLKTPNVIRIGEGIAGEAARGKRQIVLHDIPSTYLSIKSALGNTVPRCIGAYPLVHDARLVGVVEVGMLDELTAAGREFMDEAAEILAVAISVNMTRQKVNELLVQSQSQEEELRVQQEELQQSNEELEERAQLLEQQRAEIQAKNQEIEKAAGEIARKAQEVEQISTYKSEFLANMSHELRTPLNSLMILSGHLEENREKNLTAKQVEYATTIRSAGEELLSLINDILDLSKIEAGKVEFLYEDASPAYLCDQLAAMFRPLAEHKGLAFTTVVEEGLGSISIDAQRTLQILKNLLSNAIKFTRSGSIRLDVQPSPPGENPLRLPAVAFAVTDTGIGIPHGKHEMVFQAFQQADGSTSRLYGGTGLGLSISRELARGMKGELVVSSEEGKGSCFTLYLPAAAGSETGTALPAPFLAPPSRERSDTMEVQVPDDRDRAAAGARAILIIEDDVEFAQLLMDRVRERGFAAIVTTTGASGIELAEKYLPAAILLDVMLPETDGWEVMRKLKDNLRIRHIPVHFITCVEERQKALQMGGIGFTRKPVTCDDLDRVLATVENTLSHTERRVLIVEDDKNEAAALVALLEGRDITLVLAGTGAEAIDLLNRQRFQAIVLDLGLADMSGFDLLEHLRSMNEESRAPVIVHTGRELSPEETKRLQQLAQSIIIKGAKSPERLLNEVTLFLHVMESTLPPDKQRMIRRSVDNKSLLEGKKVLLVDDDMRNVFSLSSVLFDHGMTVVEAENGEKALARLDEQPDINIVLMDIMMPEMDGLEATRRIRSQSRFSRLPIIALTAKAMKGDREECLRAGASDYITKPVDTQRLLSLMRVWLYQDG